MSSCSSKEKTITDLSQERYNEYYQKGCDLIQPFMVLHGNEIKSPQSRKIKEGIMYLDNVKSFIEEVRSGKRKQPKTYYDLMKYFRLQ